MRYLVSNITFPQKEGSDPVASLYVELYAYSGNDPLNDAQAFEALKAHVMEEAGRDDPPHFFEVVRSPTIKQFCEMLTERTTKGQLVLDTTASIALIADAAYGLANGALNELYSVIERLTQGKRDQITLYGQGVCGERSYGVTYTRAEPFFEGSDAIKAVEDRPYMIGGLVYRHCPEERRPHLWSIHT